MNNTIITEYPLWFVVICLTLGLFYAALLYYREKRNEFSQQLKWLLAVFRTLLVTVIAFLLLNPLIRSKSRHSEKPVIIFAQDNSGSLKTGKDSTFYNDEYLNEISNLKEDLKSEYNLEEFLFGEKTRAGETVDYTDLYTDISNLFDQVYTRFYHRNVGAMILASDGIYNRGSNPLYIENKLGIPVYTVALGDTNARKDIILNKINFNRIAYLNNSFPVEINLSGRLLSDKRSRLFILKDGKLIHSQEIRFRGDNDFQTIRISLKAEEAGLQRYTVRLDEVEEEVSYQNNSRDFFIEVLEGKQKILLLGDAPHPDISAIKQAVLANINYEFEHFQIREFDKQVNAYNLLILHGLPSIRNNISGILNTIRENEIPVCYIVTQNTHLPIFNEQQTGITIQPDNVIYEEMLPLFNEDFRLFSLPPATLQVIEMFPPLIGPYSNIAMQPSAMPLFYIKIGNLPLSQPLLAVNQGLDVKTGILLGEGIWRWRIKEFANNGQFESFNDLINKLVQYLSIKVDKSLFRVFHENNFTENQAIEFDAEVYNEIYELNNDNEINLTIINSAGEEFPFSFSRTERAYYLNAGNFQEDSYKYIARVNTGNKLLTESGEFTVSALEIENINTVADHNLLYNIARSSGGEMIFPAEMIELKDKLISRGDIKTITYTQKKFSELLNLPWLLGLLLLVLSLEWFLRKRAGGY